MPGQPKTRARRAARAEAEAAGVSARDDAELKRTGGYPFGYYENDRDHHAQDDGISPTDRDDHNHEHVRSKVRCAQISVHTEKQCRSWAMRGSDPPRCPAHARPRERARAMVAQEVRQWRLGDTHVDPGEMLLRLVSQAAQRLDKLSTELAEKVGDEGLHAALIGEVRVPTESGSYVSGDYVRGLARLESEERDRLANFAKIAIAAGLAMRQVELAEAQGRMMAAIMRRVFNDPELGLTEAQLEAVPGVLRRAQTLALPAGEAGEAVDGG